MTQPPPMPARPPAGFDLKLTFLAGRATPEFFYLSAGGAMIGNSPESEIHLKDASVAPRAAFFEAAPGGFIIRNIGPTDSVLVNSAPVAEILLKAGMSHIQVGPFKMKAEVVSRKPGAKPMETSRVSVEAPLTAGLPDLSKAKGTAVGGLLFKISEGGMKRFLLLQGLFLLAAVGGYAFFGSSSDQSVLARILSALGVDDEAHVDEGAISPIVPKGKFQLSRRAGAAGAAAQPEPKASENSPLAALQASLKDHDPNSPCSDFTGFAFLGDDKPDPTGGAADPKKQNALIASTVAKARQDAESDFFTFFSSPAGQTALATAYRTLTARDPFCAEVGEDTPRCTELTARRVADLFARTLGYTGVGAYATRALGDLEAEKAVFAAPKIQQVLQEKTRDVLRAFGFNRELEAIRVGLLPNIKSFLSTLVQQKFSSPGDQKWALAKIQAVDLDVSSCGEMEGLIPRLISGAAAYLPESNSVAYCPGDLGPNTSRFHLVFKLGRLFARVLGPCYFTTAFSGTGDLAGLTPPVRSELADAIASCMREPGSIWGALMSGRILAAKVKPEGSPELCSDTNVYDGTFADWLGTAILMNWVESQKGKLPATEMKWGYRNVWRNWELLQTANEAVVGLVYRLDGIFVQHSALRQSLGCAGPHPKYKSCH